MSDISILYEGSPVGSGCIMQEGLYCSVSCRCKVPSDQVFRAYAESDDGPFCLGVLVPEGDAWCLRRRFACSAFPRNLTAVTVAGAEGAWHDWSGTVAGVPVSGGLARTVGGVHQVAVPWEPEQAEAYLPFLRHCTPVEIQGSRYLAVEPDGLEDL